MASRGTKGDLGVSSYWMMPEARYIDLDLNLSAEVPQLYASENLRKSARKAEEESYYHVAKSCHKNLIKVPWTDNMPVTTTCQSRLTKQHLGRLPSRIEDPTQNEEFRILLTHPATVLCSMILNEVRSRSRT